MKAFKIGNVLVKNGLLLSPMVDVTDMAYRILCRKQGAGMAYTEMLYADAITHGNMRTMKLMRTSKEDRPVGLQITGSSAAEFKKLAKMEEMRDYGLIDINCGCPSMKITGNQAGSYLLKNPEKIAGMIRTLKDEGFVTTAKIRLGFRENNVLKVAKIIEKAGADALTVHTRLATQGAGVRADWKWISRVKREIGIPVIGNGDVFSGVDCKRMFEQTGCDGCMVARAAIGNPFVFREILRYLKTGKEKAVDKKERLQAFTDYMGLAGKLGIAEVGRVRYIGLNFLKQFDGASKARTDFMKLGGFEEMAEYAAKLK